MSDIAIRIENLGKLYSLGGRAPYHRFTDLLTCAATAPFRAARAMLRRPPVDALTPETQASRDCFSDASTGQFWALRDVNLQINHGEVVGIIGRNGAGKSTLLKILSRITEPTTGRITIHGRVGSLLEVGTGFHPELTGRENIYLNGAILGMNRAEVRRKFDEIVDFAEIERFLDTPVKHYSSGMYMRLAFSVAAHLEPEILIVDEVLAVGDIEFQRKCLGKMDAVGKSGRTVLFVSHQMEAMRRLCQHGVLLDRGQVVVIGDIETAVASYFAATQSCSGLNWDREKAGLAPVNQWWIRRASISQGSHAGEYVTSGESVRFRVEIEGQEATDTMGIELVVRDSSLRGVLLCAPALMDNRSLDFRSPAVSVEFETVLPLLATGYYTVDVRLVVPNVKMIDEVPSALRLQVVDPTTYYRGWQFLASYNVGLLPLRTQAYQVEALTSSTQAAW